jgi:hypothetical protein
MEAHFEVVNLNSRTSIYRIAKKSLHTFLDKAEDIEFDAGTFWGCAFLRKKAPPLGPEQRRVFPLTARDQNSGNFSWEKRKVLQRNWATH